MSNRESIASGAQYIAESWAHEQVCQARPSRAFLTSLHPSGDPSTMLSIDSPADWQANARQGDVVVLALTSAQCRNAGQREAMIKRGLLTLAPNAVLWVNVPGQWRLALMSALRASGMIIGVPTIRRARGPGGTEFALTRKGLRFALSNGHISHRWRLALAVLERVPWGRAMLLRLLPGVGFPAFKPGTRPFAWLGDIDGSHVALQTSWRGPQAPFLVFAIANDVAVIAKRGGTDCHASVSHEAAMLRLLGAGLAKTGLEVPRLIDCHRTPRIYSLIETAVPGRPMASWIREGHHRNLGTIADRLAAWLSRWNSKTIRHVELTPARGESLITSAARELVDTIDQGAFYLDWISRGIARLIGHKVPLVAAHNDLTMVNVLGDLSGIRSVVDWEAANIDGLPLADFRYAVCDAATAIGGGDRVEAFRTCFLEDGEVRLQILRSEARLRAIVGGPPGWLELCTHAGWLRHAANEQARSSSLDTAFTAIANVLADSVLRR